MRLAMRRPFEARFKILRLADSVWPAWVHPSLDRRYACGSAGCWFSLGDRGCRPRLLGNLALYKFRALSRISLHRFSRLFEGLPTSQFHALTAYVQSPQHMIPRPGPAVVRGVLLPCTGESEPGSTRLKIEAMAPIAQEAREFRSV